MGETLKVYQKWEDLAVYLYKTLESYPRSAKHVLAADTRRAAMAVGRYLYRANSVSKLRKHSVVEQADEALVDLKLLIRMGMLLGYLPLKKYEIASGQAVEIGKMIGGLLKSTG